MLIRRAEVEGRAPLDVRIRGERIAEIGAGLSPEAGEEVIDAAGGALLPGLHDHHIHLFALAAAEASARCGPPQVRDAGALARALRAAAVDVRGWVRGVGYHESVAGELDRGVLDGLLGELPRRPVRVQQRSGALWVVNSAGVELLGLDSGVETPSGVERDASGRATGRLYRCDGWLRERLGVVDPPSLASVGRRLARYGVTGLTDATPGNGPSELAAFVAAVEASDLPQRLVLMGTNELPVSDHPAVARGARKLILTDADLPAFDDLVAWIGEAHAAERAAAIHCVTRAELVLATGAFAAAGCLPGDRIEHASVAPPDVAARLAELPLTVVTQPNFVHERGDAYATDVDAADRPWLYRCAGLLELGIPLGAGTDAPFGDPDPWAAMRAAVDRKTLCGAELGPAEALDPECALALFTTTPDAPGGPPRRVEVGQVADLCLLDGSWLQSRESLSCDRVRATIVRGRSLVR